MGGREGVHGLGDRWRRWQVVVGKLGGWVEGDRRSWGLTIGLEGQACTSDYSGEEERRKQIKALVETARGDGGSVEVLFTENGLDCLFLVAVVEGGVVVVEVASVCRMEVGLVVSWGAGPGTYRLREGEHSMDITTGSLTLANVFIHPDR